MNSKTTTLPGVSIVIPAYNEEKFLPATLAAARAACLAFTSRYPSVPCEIIVVDNASTDRTIIVARELGACVVGHPARNISSVRNAGIKAAAFSLVIMIDADSFLPPHGLVATYELMQSGLCIGGAYRVRVLSDKWLVKVVAPLIQATVRLISGISGAMFFFDRDAALAIGGFREDRLVAEDSTFAFALRAYGRRQGLRFTHFNAVTVGTLDRKEASLAILFPLVWQLLGAFAGRKQTIDDLKYWYDPKR